MSPIAHIGNIPVEEWLPFLVPVIAIWLYVRTRERRRRAAVQRLLDAGGELEESTIAEILERWSAAKHGELSAEHVRLLSPPGADGASARELARRIGRDVDAVERLLDELAELGYAEIEHEAASEREW